MTDEWDGQERRHERQPIHCLHEQDWGSLKATVENLDRRINGSLISIQRHMDDGKAWRLAIVGVMVTVALQIFSFSYIWGSLSRQVSVNTAILKDLNVSLHELERFHHDDLDKALKDAIRDTRLNGRIPT